MRARHKGHEESLVVVCGELMCCRPKMSIHLVDEGDQDE